MAALLADLIVSESGMPLDTARMIAEVALGYVAKNMPP